MPVTVFTALEFSRFKRKYRETNEWMDGQTVRQSDGRMDGWIDG